MWATVVFIAIFIVVFTSMFRYGDGFVSGLVDGVKYWWAQHDVGRGSQRWFFYGTIYAGYEWLLLGVAARRARRDGAPPIDGRAWFTTMAVVQFAVYSWAGEKFAWLALHPLLPAVLLAGVGAAGRRRAVRLPRAATTGAGATRCARDRGGLRRCTARRRRSGLRSPTATTRASCWSRCRRRTGRRPDRRVRAARRRGTLGPILVDQRDGGSWPWAWYLHEFNDVGYFTVDPASTAARRLRRVHRQRRRTAAGAGGLRHRAVPVAGVVAARLRPVDVGDLVRWIFTRDTWSPTGTLDQYLIIKPAAGVAVAAGRSG